MIILAAYCIHASTKQNLGDAVTGDIKFWAGTILIYIGIGSVANVIVQIVFHIVLSVSIAVKETIERGQSDDKEIEKRINSDMVEDEMDRLISLKSMRISFFVAGLGFMAGLIAIILNYSAVVMLNILFITFSGGSVLEGFAQIYYYRKGVYHV
jgi:hypothetical protein